VLIIEQVAIGLVPIIIGFTAGRVWERAKLHLEYSYIRRLIAGKDRVQIVVSSVEISGFKYTAERPEIRSRVSVPRNVLYMPMAEGRAVAKLTALLHRVNPKVRVQLVTPRNHDPEIPTFSVGGPSVNAFSSRVLRNDFPDFKIEYPTTRRARYGGQVFETRSDGNNMITGDYGFIFLTKISKGVPCVIFCGIRAFGSSMAVELFGELSARSEAAKLVSHGRKSLIVAEGSVDGLEEFAVSLAFCRELPARQER